MGKALSIRRACVRIGHNLGLVQYPYVMAERDGLAFRVCERCKEIVWENRTPGRNPRTPGRKESK